MNMLVWNTMASAFAELQSTVLKSPSRTVISLVLETIARPVVATISSLSTKILHSPMPTQPSSPTINLLVVTLRGPMVDLWHGDKTRSAPPR